MIETQKMNSQNLDVRGLRCPLPILKAKKALAVMNKDDILTVLTDDAGAPDDFIAFCRQTGHQLLELSQQEHGFKLVLKHR